MAQVTLQVVVNDSQLNTLVGKVNALDGKKINIGVSGASQANRDVQDIQSSLGKVNGELAKTVETFGPDGKLVKGVNTYKTGINETTQDTQKLNKATGNMVTVSRKVTTDLTKGQKVAGDAARQHSAEVQKQGLLYKTLGTSLSNFITRIVAYRAIYGAIQKITQGFTEALKAMKAVDDELVTVRKVTGFDDDQIENIKNLSYSTASKYGAEASDYLSAVAAFSRAGYKELATELAELSLKTQIVGDTTQDVANQFLISVDAAYKYKGSVEALTKVLDGANEIDNKYATTIEKIAEGMGIVAPVAAQMHVSIEELTAALGTITAVTQRSGSESARALRALFLNIVGDTKTEIEEGVTWTTGEIAGLQDVIKTYAKDAYLAAQATGGIIDPMRAMEGLSKSLKDGLLTEAELMEMVSDIGGKLRTSQLLALINNWDMYESMLNDYKNAYGSADKEIENAMDSWSRKTAVLKNTWTEFLQKTIKTEEIKKLLDFLSSAIRHTDSLTGVIVRLGIAFIGLNLGKIVSGFQSFFATLSAGTATLNSTAGIIGVIAVALTALYSIIVRLKAASDERIEKEAAAEAERRKQAEAERKAAIEESKSSIESNKERIAQLEALRAAYLNITSAKYTEEEQDAMLVEWKNKLAEAYGVEKSALEQVNAERQTGIDLMDEEQKRENKRAYSEGITAYDEARKVAYSQGYSFYSEREGGYLSGNTVDETLVNTLIDLYGATGQQGIFGQDNFLSENGFSFGHSGSSGNLSWEESIGFVGSYSEYIAALTEGLDKLAETRARNGKLTKEEQQAQDFLNAELEAANKAYEDAKATIESFMPIFARYTLDYLGVDYSNIKGVNEFTEALDKITEAEKAGSLTAEESAGIIKILAELYPSYAAAVGIAVEAVDDHADSLQTENRLLGENERALEKDATAAEHAAAAKKDAEAAARKLIPALFNENGELTETAKQALAASSYLADLVQAELNAQNEANRANYARLRAELAATGTDALRAMASLAAFYNMSRSASYAAQHGLELHAIIPSMGPAMGILAQIAEVEAAMNAIDNQMTAVSPYTSGYSSGSGSGSHSGGGSSGSGGKSSADSNLKALQDRISLLKSELSLMQERGDSEDALKAKMREIQKALKAEENYLISIKGSQIDINKLEEEWWSYQNKIQDSAEKTKEAEEATAKAIQDAVDAQIALNNAMKERNVHVFNSATGRWEWQADPSAVQSARENLINAAQNLPDGIRENFVREYGITLPGAQSVSNINGTNNYGNTYNFGSFTLTEDQARSMSVYELARLSQTLGVYGNSV